MIIKFVPVLVTKIDILVYVRFDVSPNFKLIRILESDARQLESWIHELLWVENILNSKIGLACAWLPNTFLSLWAHVLYLVLLVDQSLICVG